MGICVYAVGVWLSAVLRWEELRLRSCEFIPAPGALTVTADTKKLLIIRKINEDRQWSKEGT